MVTREELLKIRDRNCKTERHVTQDKRDKLDVKKRRDALDFKKELARINDEFLEL